MGLASILGVGAGVLLVAVLAVRFSVRLGLPSLLVYLGLGLLLGESGLGIRFDASVTQSIGLAALVLILAEGGLSTRWSMVRPSLWLGLVLSTVSVAVSIGVLGAGLHWLLGLGWRTALLWGAVVSSTDAAAVFSVLRGVGIRPKLAGALELESGLNDAPAFIAVLLFASADTLHWWTLPMVGYELVAGAGIGLALGWLGAWALRRAALPATGLYPLATVGVCVLAYAVGQWALASGFLATYTAALMLGNARLPHRSDTLSFAEGLGWLAQIGLFVLLGLYASPERLGGALVAALVAAGVLVVARLVSVLFAAVPFRLPWRETAFLSWSGLRGAVPIVLAMIPLTRGIPGADRLVDVVFVLVVLLTLVQGGTLGFLARRLGLVHGAEPTELQVDSAPLDLLGAALLQVKVPPRSRLHGVYLAELRLPLGAMVSLLVRNGKGFTPSASTRLQEGDHLLVVTTEGVRGAAERRIRAVDRSGRTARWRGDVGDENDSTTR